MNRSWPLFTSILFVTCGAVSWAGTVTYVGIPSTQSDSNCGINRSHGYTTAVDGGNTRGTNRTLNGITLFPLTGAGQNTAVADNCTLNALSGTLTDAGLTTRTIAADGTVREFLSDMLFNNAGGDNSQIEIVLDPKSLEQGATYDLRVYICSSSGQNRQVNLSFFGDGQNGVETGFFNEDDARTSAGGFPTANQVYYINYRYTWDGDSTPGITVIQKSGGAPFCFYALTNELVEWPKVKAAAGALEGQFMDGNQSQTSQTGISANQPGANQHHKKDKGKVRGEAVETNSGANANNGRSPSFDQHPLRNGARANIENESRQGPQGRATGKTEAGGNVQVTARYHPGQSVKKQTGGAAGEAASGVQAGSANQGMNIEAEANKTTVAAEGGAESSGAPAKKRNRRHRATGVGSRASSSRPKPSATPTRAWRIQP